MRKGPPLRGGPTEEQSSGGRHGQSTTGPAERIRARLRAGGNDYAPAWQPEAGDELVGTVESVVHLTSTHYPEQGSYPCVTIVSEDGSRLAFHGYRQVARQKLEAEDPRPGDSIGIAYLGKRASSIGVAYHDYAVVVERAER